MHKFDKARFCKFLFQIKTFLKEENLVQKAYNLTEFVSLVFRSDGFHEQVASVILGINFATIWSVISEHQLSS